MSLLKRSSGPLTLTGKSILDLLNIRQETASKEKVDGDSALGVSAFYRGVNLIAGSVAAAPLEIQNRKTKEIERFRLLENPSSYLSVFEFWEMATSHVLVHGDFIAWKRRRGNSTSQVVELVPFDPRNVAVYVVKRRDGTVVDRIYEVSLHAKSEKNVGTQIEGATAQSSDPIVLKIPSEDIFHVMDLSLDGIRGRSRVTLLREPIGTVQATERYAAKLFGNGALLSGVLQTDKRLSEEDADALRSRWRQKLAGVDNAHEIAILDSGASFESMSMSADDAQFIDARRFGVAEMARILGVPKHLLYEGELTDGIEQTSQEFVRYTLKNFGKRITSRLEKDVLHSTQIARFNFADLVAPDMRTMAQSMTLHRNSNITTINEEREALGHEPIDDERANDVFFAPEPKGGAKQGDNQTLPGQSQPTVDDPDQGDEPDSEAPR